MKKLGFSILCALFLLSANTALLQAQSSEEGQNYYSNPKKGIKPSIPDAYYDTAIVSKSDNLTIELVGLVADTTPTKDSLHFGSLSKKSASGFSLRYGENPYYWGPNIYYSWDPWYSPYWNSWYYPGWGGSHWMLTYGWGAGPYWGLGWGWSWGWGYPWWYWDPYYYHYYSFCGFYGWGYHPTPSHNSFGHRYLGNSRTSMSNPTSRSAGANPAPRRGTVRRGGVDLNNGGRAPRGSISGTRSENTHTTSANDSRNSSYSNNYGNGRYAKPESVAARRSDNASRNRSYSSDRSRGASSLNGSRSTYSNSRGTYNNSRQSSNKFENSSRTTSSRSFSTGSRSSSSSRSSFGSSSSSRSSSFGSSSFGGGGSRSGGSSSRR